MSNPKGRPVENHERMAWAMRFNLTERQTKRLSPKECEQLSMCKDDEARRILLGIREEL